MAVFLCSVVELEVKPHPNADKLEIAVVDNMSAIVPKGQYKTGDRAIFIENNTIIPDKILQEMGLEGKLAGPNKNRLKVCKIRGVVSEGLIYPNKKDLPLGHDCTDELGVIKYVAPVPPCMSGQVESATGYTLTYDIENFKKHKRVFNTGEAVCLTEKIHGTWCCIGINNGRPIITSKGLSARGLVLKLNSENERNVYVRTFNKYSTDIAKLLISLKESAVYILGEVFGRKVQDLEYGRNDIDFRVFDIFIGQPKTGRYVDANRLTEIASLANLKTVPFLYQGPFFSDLINDYTEGDSLLGPNIREGIVLKPQIERYDNNLGRVILKSVSEQYLLRKGGTEYN